MFITIATKAAGEATVNSSLIAFVGHKKERPFSAPTVDSDYIILAGGNEIYLADGEREKLEAELRSIPTEKEFKADLSWIRAIKDL